MESCMICNDEVTNENPLFICVSCDIKVHKLCYGVEGLQHNWKCSPCTKSESKKHVKCQLCCKKNGPMKQTEKGGWVHVICALFMTGVTISNDQTMEPIDLSKVPASKRNKTCTFCNSTKGYCATCSEKKCQTTFHITCAQNENTLKEVVDPKNDKISFKAYCKAHKPTDSSHRLSSGSIMDKVDEKREKMSDTMNASKNVNWILDEIGSHSTPVKASKKSIRLSAAKKNATPAKSTPNKTQKRPASSAHNSSAVSKCRKVDVDRVEDQNSTKSSVSAVGVNKIALETLKVDNKVAPISVQKEPHIGKSSSNVHLSENDNGLNEVTNHTCYKDKIIEELTVDLKRTQRLNLQLQEQLLAANQEKRQESSSSKIVRIGLPNAEIGVAFRPFGSMLNTMEPVLDDIYYKYPNGVKLLKAKIDFLDTIGDGPTCDREYINKLFPVAFPDAYITKYLEKGVGREKMLGILREKKRYITINQLYDRRVISSGKGDIKVRTGLFKTTFRTKLNNWMFTHAPKIQLVSETESKQE